MLRIFLISTIALFALAAVSVALAPFTAERSVAKLKGIADTNGSVLKPRIKTTASSKPTIPTNSIPKVGAKPRKAVQKCLNVGGEPSPMFTATVRYTCNGGTLQGYQGCYGACVTTPPGAPPPVEKPDVLAMVRGALEQVPEPEPNTSPPLLTDDEYGVVGIPFFFGVDPPQWQTVSVTTAGAGKFLTINATPVALAFNPGDGSPTPTCNNGGRAVRTRAQAADAKKLGCFHLYQVASPADKSYAAKLAITWNLAVDTNLDEEDLVNLVPATMVTTTDINVPIIEIQAVLANPSG